MIPKQLNNKNQPELNRELQEMIPGGRIAWGKTREQIWTDLEQKMELTLVQKNRVVYSWAKNLSIAAAFLILLGIPAALLFPSKTIDTSNGYHVQLFLPDSSRVVINPQSVLSYHPMAWKFSRVVKLNGEAFFEVQKGRRFEVVSSKGKTTVLGTEFSVFARGNEYTVTCISGKVKVKEPEFQNEVIISSGQRAILKSDGEFDIIELQDAVPKKPINLKDKALENELDKVLDATLPLSESTKEQSLQMPIKSKVISASEKNTAGKQDFSNEEISSQPEELIESQITEQTPTSSQEEVSESKQYLNKIESLEKEPDTENRQTKDRFRNSLTPEQISILENQQLSKDEKRKAFLESLSEEQRQLLEERNRQQAGQTANQMQGNTDNDNIRAQQKTQSREQAQEGASLETQEQQKQQNRKKIENQEQGNDSKGGNKTGR